MFLRLNYSEKISHLMQFHYSSLPEKQRRHYAATEALKLGYGGISCISRILSVKRNTISQGIKDLAELDDSSKNIYARQRKEGGGRKKKKQLQPF